MKLKKIIPITIVGIGALIALFLYFSPNNLFSPTDSVLRQKLLATENNIPTEAGKKNFLKQSANLTQKVDP